MALLQLDQSHGPQLQQKGPAPGPCSLRASPWAARAATACPVALPSKGSATHSKNPSPTHFCSSGRPGQHRTRHQPGSRPSAAEAGWSSMAHIAWTQHALLVRQAGTTWCASTTLYLDCCVVCPACGHAEQHKALLPPALHQALLGNRQGPSRCTCLLEHRQPAHWSGSPCSTSRH